MYLSEWNSVYFLAVKVRRMFHIAISAIKKMYNRIFNRNHRDINY